MTAFHPLRTNRLGLLADRMKPSARTTVIAVATFVSVITWLFAAFGIAGVWLDCIPNDPEYGCPTTTAAWERTAGFLAAAAIITLGIWVGTRRRTSVR
jgi:uncharacterized membrane protein